METLAGIYGLVAALGLLALAVAWIITPFAIFGTKPILRELLAAVKENNRLTRELQQRLGPPAQLPAAQPASAGKTTASAMPVFDVPRDA
jgi:hypothetical protein